MNAIVQKDIQDKVNIHYTKITHVSLSNIIMSSWEKIAPGWPLKNLIAVNPLSGLECLPFNEALGQAEAYFQQEEIPYEVEAINRESIKWLQAFFDDGQAAIQMPNRHLGLFKATLSLIKYDKKLENKCKKLNNIMDNYKNDVEQLITSLLSYLGLEYGDYETFITLLLTTLPGWASYVKYRTDWPDSKDSKSYFYVTKEEYVAFRLLFACLLWPEARQLLGWHKSAFNNKNTTGIYKRIQHSEYLFQKRLLKRISLQEKNKNLHHLPNAQFVFCIDVRSEPFRRAIETQGNFETFGFAGFFGLPVSIKNKFTKERYASCPVLLSPVCDVISESRDIHKIHSKIYQSLKYNFTTPFIMVEILGLISGAWMAIKSCVPKRLSSLLKIRKMYNAQKNHNYDISSISIQQQVDCAINMLKLIGLVENFSPLVVLCGHGSSTENNAYSTSLDCGACGGRPGGANARIMASILNSEVIRNSIKDRGISIPATTYFAAAEHNTTTDELIFCKDMPDYVKNKVKTLKTYLETAQKLNTASRLSNMNVPVLPKDAVNTAYLYANDWARVRPEWGLARNAAFIVGPRSITRDINLEGRAFLHSYDWQIDDDASLLNLILTAPMIVAQWINAQYLFSTLDNVAFGGGSKITKNITGKIGIMQGNASDLMFGLPLQSVFSSDDEAYHIPVRLTVIVYSPLNSLKKVIEKNDVLKKLFRNEWVHLFCLEPFFKHYFKLKRDLTWEKCR